MKTHDTAYGWKDVLPSMQFGQIVSIICCLPGYIAASLLFDKLASPAVVAKSNPAVIGFVLYFTIFTGVILATTFAILDAFGPIVWTIPYICICCLTIYCETELLEMRFAIEETAFCAQLSIFILIYATGITAYCRKVVQKNSD